MEKVVKTQNESKYKDEKVLTPGQLVWLRLKRNKLAMFGMILLIIMVLSVVLVPFITGWTMEGFDIGKFNNAPSTRHLLGTDGLGRDILTRLFWGGRISILIGIVAVIVDVLFGILFGVIAGFYGGIVDSLIMRFVDILLALPFFPILIALGAILSDFHVKPEYRIFLIMFILGFISWPGLARMIRGQILTLREQEFMLATEALGLRDSRKMFKHLMPNTIPMIIVYATMGVAGNILFESALSFLSLGVQPPWPSWGNMITASEELYNMQNRPWLWIPAGVCIFVTIMAINLFGDGLRDAIDPKLKR